MIKRAAVIILAGLALAGCEQQIEESSLEADSSEVRAEEVPAEVAETPQVTAQDELAATLPLPGERPSIPIAANVPHVYMALQPDAASGPVSVVFTIDRSRDNSPEDDPALRITPEDGKCNPQELRRFSFLEASAQRPIFGPEEARRGITAKELPNFMAMMVTGEMLRTGLVVEPEASKPHNVCTRKLWERLIVNQSAQGTGQG
ncbi:MAG: hypothetical protein ACFB03_02920 [Paracoccaceae bacterium]